MSTTEQKWYYEYVKDNEKGKIKEEKNIFVRAMFNNMMIKIISLIQIKARLITFHNKNIMNGNKWSSHTFNYKNIK